MCGRFVSAGQPDKVAEFFGAPPPEVSLPASSNIAPTNDVYAVFTRADGTRRMAVFHWGLVPSWANDIKSGHKMINARAETLLEKRTFKPLLRTRRCIVPMGGFYEWRPGREGGPTNARGRLLKVPLLFERRDHEPLAVAGLWTSWRDRSLGDDAPWLHSCTVVTAEANALMAPVHDRMPVILDRQGWLEWLDPTVEVADALALLRPCPDDVLTVREVSTEVNDVRNKGPF